MGTVQKIIQGMNSIEKLEGRIISSTNPVPEGVLTSNEDDSMAEQNEVPGIRKLNNP